MLTQTPFPIIDVCFKAQLERQIEWPSYAGSLFRGIFGASLRHISCMTGFKSCHGCPLLETCPFPLLFEPPPRDLSAVGIQRTQQGMPSPFVLLIPPTDYGKGKNIHFGMRLFGTAIERFALVVEAWRRAFERGLGRERVRGRLCEAWDMVSGDLLYDGETLAPFEVMPRILEAQGSNLEIRSLTPLRFLGKGTPLGIPALTPRRLVADVVRRARILASGLSLHVAADVAAWPVETWLEAAGDVKHNPELVWRDWRRYSFRQKQAMNLGGYVGTWIWKDITPDLQRLLALGSILHIGKDTSFGLGAYTLAPLSASNQPARAPFRS
jgi:hypothetical protein